MPDLEEPVPGVHSVLELLEVIEADRVLWQRRWVKATFEKHPDVELSVYWQSDDGAPYFDVSYRGEANPAKALAALLVSNPTCEVIDWCPGRLLTVQAHGATTHTFSDLILAVVAELHGPIDQRLRATQGQMRAA